MIELVPPEGVPGPTPGYPLPVYVRKHPDDCPCPCTGPGVRWSVSKHNRRTRWFRESDDGWREAMFAYIDELAG